MGCIEGLNRTVNTDQILLIEWHSRDIHSLLYCITKWICLSKILEKSTHFCMWIYVITTRLVYANDQFTQACDWKGVTLTCSVSISIFFFCFTINVSCITRILLRAKWKIIFYCGRGVRDAARFYFCFGSCTRWNALFPQVRESRCSHEKKNGLGGGYCLLG